MECGYENIKKALNNLNNYVNNKSKLEKVTLEMIKRYINNKDKFSPQQRDEFDFRLDMIKLDFGINMLSSI